MKHHRGVILACFSVAAGTAAVLSLSCGGGKSTSGPTTVPTPIPTPKPTTTPTASASCRLGYGSVDADDYEMETQLLPYLEAAMDQLIAQKPQIFDLGAESSPGSQAYKVLDRKGYLDGLVNNLRGAGLCADLDLDAWSQDIVWAKISNDYSEEFRVLRQQSGSDFMRRGIKAYRVTYTPANFPFVRPSYYPPVGSGCYKPFPPEIQRMNGKVHLKQAGYDQLDSTPIVMDPMYCAAFGFPNADCPIRPEGWEGNDRVACENWRVGTSRNTGRPGPTWTNTEGQLCDDPAKGTTPASGCMVSPVVPYQLWAYKVGVYKVCAQTGNCRSIDTEAER